MKQWAAAILPLQAHWAGLSVRERRLVQLAAAAVLAAGLWQGLLGPALGTLAHADAQARQLDAQLQHMKTLQAQARALRDQPVIGASEAQRALEWATRQTLGTAGRLQFGAEHPTVILQGASADALAQWLAQVRVNAHAVPLEARLSRSSGAGAAGWTGVIVMRLPPTE